MNEQEAIKQFRRVYPDANISCFAKKIDKRHWLIRAVFDDGTFYFIVGECLVSCACKTEQEAIDAFVVELD